MGSVVSTVTEIVPEVISSFGTAANAINVMNNIIQQFKNGENSKQFLVFKGKKLFFDPQFSHKGTVQALQHSHTRLSADPDPTPVVVNSISAAQNFVSHINPIQYPIIRSTGYDVLVKTPPDYTQFASDFASRVVHSQVPQDVSDQMYSEITTSFDLNNLTLQYNTQVIEGADGSYYSFGWACVVSPSTVIGTASHVICAFNVGKVFA